MELHIENCEIWQLSWEYDMIRILQTWQHSLEKSFSPLYFALIKSIFQLLCRCLHNEHCTLCTMHIAGPKNAQMQYCCQVLACTSSSSQHCQKNEMCLNQTVWQTVNVSESDSLINRTKSRFWFLLLFVQIVPEILSFDLKACTISAALHIALFDKPSGICVSWI